MSGRVRVLLVDDNNDFLQAVSDWLAGEPALEVAGMAHSGQEAIEQIEQLHPDLVLMDVAMSELSGFGATRRIKSDPAAPLVVLMTFLDSEAARREALAAGADEFIAKADVTGRLTALIRDLLSARLGREKEQSQRLTKQAPPRDS